MKSFSPQHWEHFKTKLPAIEAKVSEREGAYPGLLAEALYTGPEDLCTIFESSHVQGTFVDLGAGIGITCLVYGQTFPERKAIGVEFESSRLNFAQELAREFELNNTEYIHADLLQGSIPEGDTYFLYFPTGMVLDKILHELYHSCRDFTLVAIESHGDLFPRLAKENWLKLVEEVSLKASRHHPMARIYQRQKQVRSRDNYLHDLSFQHKILVIDDGEKWLGESYQLEWLKDDLYDLKTPPRTVSSNNVQEVLSLGEISAAFLPALELRSLGMLEIKTAKRVFQGHIRKIIVSLSFRLEISTGEKVEWNEIKTISQGTRLCYVSS